MVFAIETAHANAKRTWPGVKLSYEEFSAHLSREGSEASAVPEHPSDVYLCAACSYGQSGAYELLESAYFPALRSVLGRLLREGNAVEEVLQDVRTRLFVGDSPKIASYRGRGCLAGWLRSVAVHAARDYLRSCRVQRGRLKQLSHADAATQGMLRSHAVDTLDDGVFQQERLQQCQQAWNAAIRALGSAERQLLYHHFVHGLSIDVLGVLYSVHRATVARRIQRVTTQVRRRVRDSLALHYQELSLQDLDGMAQRTCCEVDVMRSLKPLSAA